MEKQESIERNLENVIDNMKHTYIGKSKVHGFGLFASEVIEKGVCLGELDGQYISWDLFNKLMNKVQYETIKDDFFMEWNAIKPDLLLTRPFRTKYSYINHSRTPNVKIEKEPLRIVTMRKIEFEEELLLDYREEDLSEEYLNGHGKTYL